MSTSLRGPLKTHLEDDYAAERLERVRRRVAASRRMPRSSARRWAPALAVAAFALAIGVGWWWRAPSGAAVPGPITLASGAPFSGGSAERISLGDGSVLSLADGASLRVLESDGQHVLLTQSDGRVTYDIRPGGPRRWSIDAGALSVDVLGTRFTIDRHGDRARVDVARGRVRVRTAHEVRTLGAGESIAVGDAPEPTALPAPEPAPVAIEPSEPVPSVTIAPRPRPVSLPPAAPSWRALAAQGEHAEAFALLGEEGCRVETERASSVDDLLFLADTARLSGHPALAREPLARITHEFATDPRAGFAALTLGRLELDALDAPADAVQALQAAEALGVPPRLRETLLARLAEAYSRAGRSEEARAAAQRYLREAPNGLHASAMRLLAE